MIRSGSAAALVLACSLACRSGQDAESETETESESETGDPLDLPPGYECVEVVLEGPLPITVTGIDTRGRGDDFLPYIGGEDQLEDLIFAWIPAQPTYAVVYFEVDDPSLGFDERRIYQVDACGQVENFAGKSGTGSNAMVDAGQPFMFVVENCQGDCSVTVEVYQP